MHQFLKFYFGNQSLHVSDRGHILQKLTRKDVFVKQADINICRIPQKKLTPKYGKQHKNKI
jgi:hypothetical protein